MLLFHSFQSAVTCVIFTLVLSPTHSKTRPTCDNTERVIIGESPLAARSRRDSDQPGRMHQSRGGRRKSTPAKVVCCTRRALTLLSTRRCDALDVGFITFRPPRQVNVRYLVESTGAAAVALRQLYRSTTRFKFDLCVPRSQRSLHNFSLSHCDRKLSVSGGTCWV